MLFLDKYLAYLEEKFEQNKDEGTQTRLNRKNTYKKKSYTTILGARRLKELEDINFKSTFF